MKGPLAGIRILDLTTMASGPFATSILADQGADVIKVEAPGRGDALRSIGTLRGGLSALFTNLNRGKRSLGVDLTDPRGRALLDRLASTADVLIQNFRPGAARRMGIGPETLCARHPELVYVSVTGFGERGPRAQQPVYDSVMQAASGVAAHQADPETGEPTFVRSVVCDKGTALQTAQLVTAALLARARGAGGQHLHVSMLHASIAFLWPDGLQNHTFLGEGASPPIERAALPRARRTRDGWISISLIQDHEFRALCGALERPDLLDDPRFARGDARARNADGLQAEIDAALRALSSEEVVQRLTDADVPHAVIAEPATLHLDPQVVANQLLIELDHPTAGLLRQPRPVGDFEKTPCAAGRPAPHLGEHTDEIAREAGWSDAEIETLRTEGILAGPR